jgi:hypothetical protein
LLVISAISMKFYPLYGEKWDRQKAEIAERHEQ